MQIEGFSSLSNYKINTLTWIRNSSAFSSRYHIKLMIHLAIVPFGFEPNPNILATIEVDDPKQVFFSIISQFWSKKRGISISKTCTIQEGAIIGEGVSIGEFSIISSNSIIGNNVSIGHNVVLVDRVQIGDNSIIQSGSIIGEDGFAYSNDNDGNLQHVPHFGGVRIGKWVSIGSNVTIAKGSIDDTIIDDYVKIDNLVHIAHNCSIGRNTIIIPGAFIYGSVQIGQNCWISSSIIRDQVTIGDNVLVGMGSVVTKNIESGVTVIGSPAKPIERR